MASAVASNTASAVTLPPPALASTPLLITYYLSFAIHARSIAGIGVTWQMEVARDRAPSRLSRAYASKNFRWVQLNTA